MYRTNIIKIAVTFCSLWLLSGCSVYMASNQPDKKDLNVFKEGTERIAVITEIGAPETTTIVDGKKIEIYRFTQGYSSGAKTGRAIGHGVADVFTLGLWEIVGTTTEAVADGTEMAFEVVYSLDDQVESVRALTDAGSSAYENSNPGLQAQLYRKREIGIACELCGDPSLSEQFQDIPINLELDDIPEGYAIVVGSTYMNSAFELQIWPNLEVNEENFRYPASIIFTKEGAEETRFMIAGPRTHIYLVPAGAYTLQQVSEAGYAKLDIDTEEFARESGATGFEKDVTGMLAGFMNVSNKINNVVYAPIRGTAKFADKALGGKDPSEIAQELLAGSSISLTAGEVAYIGHIQLYSLQNEQFETEVIVNNEMERAKSELMGLYPDFVTSMNSRLLHLKQNAKLD